MASATSFASSKEADAPHQAGVRRNAHGTCPAGHGSGGFTERGMWGGGGLLEPVCAEEVVPQRGALLRALLRLQGTVDRGPGGGAWGGAVFLTSPLGALREGLPSLGKTA